MMKTLRSGTGLALLFTAAVLPACALSDGDEPVEEVGSASDPLAAPSAPTNLRTTSVSGAAIALAWAAPGGAVSGYRVWRGDASWASWRMIAEVGPTQTAYTDRSVTAGSTYTYGIRAFNGAGTSAGSNTVKVTAAAEAPPPPPPAPAAATFERPFAAQAWLYAPISGSPIADPDSAAMMSLFSQGSHVADLDEFGVPFHRADASTATRSVTCTEPWGTCLLQRYNPRPLTVGMLPSPGSDAAMVVVDVGPRSGSMRGRTIDEYWQYAWNGGAPTTSWGTVVDLDGDGRTGGATGAGLSRAAGVVRADEIERGIVDHALVFSTRYCKTTTFRFPASKTDGKYAGAGAIPEGARYQLDPTLNPDAYGLNRGERAIFVALQRYGAYAMDCGGATAALIFEDVPGNPGAPYQAAGLAWDYYGFSRIPWGRGRFLRSWNGQ
jgi:hypothetical protein